MFRCGDFVCFSFRTSTVSATLGSKRMADLAMPNTHKAPVGSNYSSEELTTCVLFRRAGDTDCMNWGDGVVLWVMTVERMRLRLFLPSLVRRQRLEMAWGASVVRCPIVHGYGRSLHGADV